MKQTLIYLSEDQHEALRNRAHGERSSISEIVRTAVDLYLTRQYPRMPRLPKKEAIKEARAIIKQAEEMQPASDIAAVFGNAPEGSSVADVTAHKCEAPQINCRFPGEQYQIRYMADEGEINTKIYLCPGHARKARESSTTEEMTKL